MISAIHYRQFVCVVWMAHVDGCTRASSYEKTFIQQSVYRSAVFLRVTTNSLALVRRFVMIAQIGAIGFVLYDGTYHKDVS